MWPSSICFVRWGGVSAVAIALILSPIPGKGQSGDQAALSGVAIDPSGAVVPAVRVSVHNINTSFTTSIEGNDQGLFRFPVLPAGVYQLTANRIGFASVQINRIELRVGANATLTLRFHIANFQESVTVAGEAPLLEKSTSQVSTTVDERFISDLPSNGRDFTIFALLAPGVTMDARGGLSFAGQRAMNSLLLDGINNDDPFWGQQLEGFTADGREAYYISNDAIKEFQVNSSAYSAEFGRAGGGVINTLTKSGTNELHGSGFWFYRDKSMNANDPINKLHDLPKSPFHYHQFGATLGGPIKRDRLFFFFDYDGMRSNTPNAVFLNLPSGFQLSPDPTVASFQRIALDYLSRRANSWVWPIHDNVYLGKTDWQFSNKHRLTLLWDAQRFGGGGSIAVDPQNTFEHSEATPARADTGTVSLTSAITNRTLNVAKFGFLHNSGGSHPVSINPEGNIFEKGQLVLTIGRNRSDPQESPVYQYQWADTLHHDHGSHGIKVGADVLVDYIRFFIAQNFSGSYDFGSLESFGRNLGGQPQTLPSDDYTQTFSGTGQHGVVTHPDFTSIAAFAEDCWRIRPTLTLNLGIRYDLQLIQKPNITNPSQPLLASGLDTGVLPTDKHNFAPRLGVAWSPSTTSRLVARAGYGIFYALTPSALTSRAYFQNGITTQTRTFHGDSPLASLIPRYPNTICGLPDPSGLPPNCAPPPEGAGLPTLQLFSRHYHQPYVQQGNVGFEVAIHRDLTASINYLVSKGTHLQQIRDVNLGVSSSQLIGVANTNTLLAYRAFESGRPIPGFNRILVFNSDANSIFHGMALQLNKRFSEIFHVLASYTFSKVIDDNPNVYALNPGPGNTNLVQDPSAPSLDHSVGNDDQRHRFACAAIWTPRLGASLPGPLKAIAKGWELSGIMTAQSGRPYSGLLNYDLNNDGDFASDRTPGMGRNSFYMPGTVSVDPRLTRNIKMGERTRLQIIWEAFNLLNHQNLMGVNTNEYSVSDCGTARFPCLVPQNEGLSAFGTPTASTGARIMQLAIKVSF